MAVELGRPIGTAGETIGQAFKSIFGSAGSKLNRSAHTPQGLQREGGNSIGLSYSQNTSRPERLTAEEDELQRSEVVAFFNGHRMPQGVIGRVDGPNELTLRSADGTIPPPLPPKLGKR